MFRKGKIIKGFVGATTVGGIVTTSSLGCVAFAKNQELEVENQELKVQNDELSGKISESKEVNEQARTNLEEWLKELQTTQKKFERCVGDILFNFNSVTKFEHLKTYGDVFNLCIGNKNSIIK